MTDTLRRLKHLACALAFVCATGAHVPAQTSAPRDGRPAKGGPARPARTDARRTEAEARRARERLEAAAVITEVAAGAKEIEDPGRRSWVLAEAADALWPVDEPSARAVFRRAWEAATAADEAAREAGQHTQDSGHDVYARREVLGAAARRDARLAEEFLGDLRAWIEKHAGEDDGAAGSRRGTGRCPGLTAAGQRLALAVSLLEEGSHGAAAEVAAPMARCGADGDFVLFLLRLRARDPVRADAIFLGVLQAVRADAGAGANDVLVTAAYLAPPGLLTAVDDGGGVRFLDAARAGEPADSAPRPPRVRGAFYDTAAAILLRPSPPQAGAGAHSPAAVYFALGRLLPYFERESPRHAPALHALRVSLASEVRPASRAMLERQAGVRRLVSENPTDPLRSHVDRIGGATDDAERDGLRLSAAHEAARRRLWDRARQFAGAVTDADKRRAAFFVVAARQVAALSEAYREVEAEDVERAAGFARSADLPQALRALGLARAAELASRRGDRMRALELFDEALGYASQTDADHSLRTAAALMAADHAARLDSPRAWEALSTAVGFVNTDENFSGLCVAFDAGASAPRTREQAETLDEIFGDFSLADIFGAAAHRDFALAAAEARLLKDPQSRSLALVAAARAVIDGKGSERGGAR